MVGLTQYLVALLSLLVGLGMASPLQAAHGISLDGQLKYAADFQRFAYTSEKAVPGGTLTLHALGTFDKMNPYTLKGTHPDLLAGLLFETLTVHSLDEPFAQYGLLAKDIQVAGDGLSVLFELHAHARFSDGTPVTAEDVAYSFTVLNSDKAHPLYQSYWQDVQKVVVLDKHKVRFEFKQKNRELPMITGEMPVLNRAFYSKHPFEKGDLTVPVGSGPYVVESFDPGKTITYRRNPDYWGKDLPVRRGQYNYERVVVKYFKDPVVALEGFKAGEFDFIFENNSKQWARDYVGEKFEQGRIRKEELPHKQGAGMQGWLFNMRRPLFQDKRVRQALTLALDFEWSNENLFHNQYRRSDSYFSNSEMAARGLPSPAELALLEPLRAQLDPEVFAEVQAPPSTAAPGSVRANLRRAAELLKEAGWQLASDGLLAKGGQPFKVEILLASPAFERVMAPYAANLKKLGVELSYRTVDLSLYQRRLDSFDFDMVVHTFAQSQSPGNEQRDMWHSASADIQGSRNLIGLKNPAIDALVEKIIYAESRQALVTACRALDRVLLAGHYLVPNWYLNYYRVAYWHHLQRPEQLPLYYQPESWLFTWWIGDGTRAAQPSLKKVAP
ncbi:extracellular solute-binding protein [Candidatus Magnetaquicoccus inordinatus]|uniref:extracellular solute-binding protein n=1 Tax=Candidatus Magnetaquicoccus inordinatus TaxID=2496818 RepID=UPI00102AC86A|nr:extracellular solute-binding protein [Candidatus Magnetaquicoccus inordinatus]